MGGTPTMTNYQTFSGYTGPALYGAYSVVTVSNSTSLGNAFAGYGTSNAVATSSTYFQTGLRNNYPFGDGKDALVLNFGRSGNSTTEGELIFVGHLLVTGDLEGSHGFSPGSFISGAVSQSNSLSWMATIISRIFSRISTDTAKPFHSVSATRTWQAHGRITIPLRQSATLLPDLQQGICPPGSHGLAFLSVRSMRG